MYRFNMAKGQVLTIEQRRRLFRWLGVYLTICILVIGFLAFKLTLRIVDLSLRDKLITAEERQFLKIHPKASNVDEGMRQTTADMTRWSGLMESILQGQRDGQRSATLLLGLEESLPAQVELARLSLDGPNGKINMEVFVPASMKVENDTVLPNVMGLWQKSPLLAGRISQITLENSERCNFEGSEFMNWRFSAALERGK